jgi:translation initiation factor 2 alpha subunit (eIF-2alpha)
LAIKIDISKAFDKVDWGLLEEYASLYTIIEQMDPMDDDVC